MKTIIAAAIIAVASPVAANTSPFSPEHSGQTLNRPQPAQAAPATQPRQTFNGPDRWIYHVGRERVTREEMPMAILSKAGRNALTIGCTEPGTLAVMITLERLIVFREAEVVWRKDDEVYAPEKWIVGAGVNTVGIVGIAAYTLAYRLMTAKEAVFRITTSSGTWKYFDIKANNDRSPIKKVVEACGLPQELGRL